jgi:ATP-dependent helicase/nuclease subunit A
LRGFLDWIERLAAENARMVEVPVPESDEDAVRIMTIHAAKGREFPVVMLMGIGTSSSSQSEPVIFNRKNQHLEVCVGSSNGPRFITGGYEEVAEWEKTADKAENIRLMYVAATRAKDHLIVSLYRPIKKTDNSFAACLERICGGKDDFWNPIEPADIEKKLPLSKPANNENFEADTELDRSRWIEQRQSILAVARRPASLAATTITHVNKDESAEEYPQRLGRGGTNLGRAVHSVLQSIDLASGKDLADTAKAQAENEGISDQADAVARLAQNALDSAVTKRAVASNRYYREVFVSFPYNGTSVEGFVDLLFEEDDGLVVADYKTDAIDEEPSQAKRAQYSLQAGIYALAVSRITGKPIKEVVLLFLSKPTEIVFKEIPALMIKAEDAIRKQIIRK